jgi:TusE/DsrC/DsvC family sulfur relay protein
MHSWRSWSSSRPRRSRSPAAAARSASRSRATTSEEHWKVVRFLRADFREKGETATTRRVQMVGGVPVKEQFALFPKKPGKKMAYVAGLPKPHGCV